MIASNFVYRHFHITSLQQRHRLSPLRLSLSLLLLSPSPLPSFHPTLQPAILKGWIERTFLPHSTWTLPSPSSPPASIVGLVPCLENVKKVGVVTTYGSTYGVIRYVGDPGRRIIARGLRPLFSKECTVLWLGMYNCDNATQKEREDFLAEVEAYMREF